MLHTCIDGLIMGKSVRRCVLLSYFSASISLASFSSFLWYEALCRSKESRLAAIITAVFITSLMIYILLVSGPRTIRSVSIRYNCDPQRISIQYGKEAFSMDLMEPFFVTRAQIRFYRGRGSEIMPFYLFSANPIGRIDDQFVGLKGLTNLLVSGCVIIPCDNRTDIWLRETLSISSVPDLPKVIYKPST